MMEKKEFNINCLNCKFYDFHTVKHKNSSRKRCNAPREINFCIIRTSRFDTGLVYSCITLEIIRNNISFIKCIGMQLFYKVNILIFYIIIYKYVYTWLKREYLKVCI